MKKLILGVLLLMALLTLPLFADTPNTRALPTDLTHLVVDRIGEPQELDPAWAYDTVSSEFLMNVYDTLLWFNRTDMDTYIPKLATEWKMEDINEVDPVTDMRWIVRVTFKIRTGVYFQSDGFNDLPGEGALLTPQDVEYTFERLLITDAATGPSWMLWKPLFGNYSASDLNVTLYNLDPVKHPINPTTLWDTHVDEAIDDAVQSNSTHVWFNLVTRSLIGGYEPFLQILSQSWGSIMNQPWCVWHSDWPGRSVGDNWNAWHDPWFSPLYLPPKNETSSPGPHLNGALGTGPYMLDYWNRGAGGAWSIIKNPNYWEGWTVPFRHTGWGASEPAIDGHVNRYTSNYIPAWATRRLRFLGGLSDFCDVPRNYRDQVNGWPGIQCIYPLPQLACDAFFFNYNVSGASTHMGVMPPMSTFSPLGAPANIMNDTDFRLAIAHMFNYASYLETAFLNESTSPVTPIIPGLTYYDPSIGQTEDPAIDQRKNYGISFEPADTLAYNMTKAVEYLKKCWGGALWVTGFTMDVVYNEGNFAGEIAANMIRDAFRWINAKYGTKFTINVVWLPWIVYRAEQRVHVMSLYIANWQADFPDAHGFAHPFMHSEGALSKFQGYLGATDFPNAVVDGLIDSGFASPFPAIRQASYTSLQQYYVDNAPGLVISQPTGRHWQRDWVQGWYYNPFAHGNNIYDLWKQIEVATQDVDIEIANFVCPTKIEVGLPLPTNPKILPFPSPISVTAQRLDANGAAPIVLVAIAVSLVDGSGIEMVLDFDSAPLTIGGSYTADFYLFTQDAWAPIKPGVYTCVARVLLSSGFAQDIDPTNNQVVQPAKVTVGTLLGDINVDGTIDMADISILIDAFMATPFSYNWDPICDIVPDFSIDMADVSLCIEGFMQTF